MLVLNPSLVLMSTAYLIVAFILVCAYLFWGEY
jgi:hypothetical protein